MRVRFTQMLSTPDRCYTTGSTHDIPDAEALRLIAGRVAEAVVPPAPPAPVTPVTPVTLDQIPPAVTGDATKKAVVKADKLAATSTL